MTVLTKSKLSSKPIAVDINTEENEGSDEKVLYVEGNSPPRLRPRSGGAVLCLAIIALLVASAGFMIGLELYREYMRTSGGQRYIGFCAIPVPLEPKSKAEMYLHELNNGVMPALYNMPSRTTVLRWSSSPDTDTDIEELPVPQANSEDSHRYLREELDIKDEVEKITVINGLNGHQVGFLHDFAENVTGIIDDERCFVMDLNPEFVLQPDTFVMTIEGSGEFDITRVRDTMRAVLPPLVDLMRVSRHLGERCGARPAYRLRADDNLTIRKRRSVRGEGAGAGQFTHFSGRRVQQIVVDNMRQLRQYEHRARAHN